MLLGLQIAQNLHIRNLLVEVDSSCVFQFISQGVIGSYSHAPLINAIRELVSEGNWIVLVWSGLLIGLSVVHIK